MGVSIITDACLPDALEVADIQRIIATAREAEPSLTALVEGVVARLDATGAP
jgi:purine-nucleoside phosphorylase